MAGSQPVGNQPVGSRTSANPEPEDEGGQVTELLDRWSEGDREALERLIPLVYPELQRIARRQMRRERPGHTLQTTAVVNEAYLRLLGQGRAGWHNRAQFYSVVALLMRRVLLHHGERARAAKRGGRWLRVPLDPAVAGSGEGVEELLILSEALDRLRALDSRQARIVELRVYLGCTIEEIAGQLRVSRSTVQREWRMGRAWLGGELRREDSPGREAAAGP